MLVDLGSLHECEHLGFVEQDDAGIQFVLGDQARRAPACEPADSIPGNAQTKIQTGHFPGPGRTLIGPSTFLNRPRDGWGDSEERWRSGLSYDLGLLLGFAHCEGRSPCSVSSKLNVVFNNLRACMPNGPTL